MSFESLGDVGSDNARTMHCCHLVSDDIHEKTSRTRYLNRVWQVFDKLVI